MAIILNIETATKNCSVSISKNGQVLELKEFNDGNYSHSEVLHGIIRELIEKLKLTFSEIDAFAVSKGPGSYTGLRIGVSAAKGLCFALEKPLISIDTLCALSHQVSIEDGFIIPLLDARRMEVYAAVYDNNHISVREIKAEIISENSYLRYLEQGKVIFLGDGAKKCSEVITHPNAVFRNDTFPSAREMANLSYEKYKKNDFEEVAYFEPFYLKDFLIVPEKKKQW